MPLKSLDPNPALILIDLQNPFVQAPPARRVVDRATELAAAFRDRRLAVVLVQLAYGDTAPPGRTDHPGTPHRAWSPRGDGVSIVDELAGHPGDIIVTKRNWGAFYGTDLDLHLRRRGVTQIVLGGIATSIGVESTARSAHEHGYHLALVTDAMADLDPDSHRHSITKIFPRLGQTTTTAEILAALGTR